MQILILKIIKKNRGKLLVYSLICTLFNWMFVGFFPSVHEESEKLAEAFQAYPEDFLKIFSIELGQIFDSLEGFMGVENFSILWPIVMLIFVIILSSNAIAGEIENKTISVLLSLPLSRTKVFFAKYIGGGVLIILFVFFSIFSTIPLALLHGVDFQIKSYILVSTLGFLFALATYSIGFMFSSMLSTKGKAGALTAGIMLIMYALNILATFKESLDNVKYVSFFYYYDYKAALLHFEINTIAVVVFLSISVVTTLLGLVLFKKRDVVS